MRMRGWWFVVSIVGACGDDGGGGESGSETGSGGTTEITTGETPTGGEGVCSLCYDVAAVDVRRFAVPVDVDGDGDVDVITASADLLNLSVLVNDGVGGFTAGATSGAGGTIEGGVGVDLDGDGVSEVAVFVRDGLSTSVQAFRVAGGFGQVGAAIVLSGAYARAATGDVDGDGDVDVAAHYGDVGVLVNNGGQLTLASVVTVPGSTAGLGLADVDGDGKADLITAAAADEVGVAIRLASGEGQFGGASVLPYASGGALAAGAIDGGAALDVAVAVGETEVALLRGDAGVLAALASVQAGDRVSALGIADGEGDGDGDVFAAFVSDAGGGGVSVFDQGGGGEFAGFDLELPGDGDVGTMTFADLDGDDRVDVIGAGGWLLLSRS